MKLSLSEVTPRGMDIREGVRNDVGKRWIAQEFFKFRSVCFVLF